MEYQNLVNKVGGSKLLPIQEKILEAVKTSNHIALYAPTGSGKTLAYILGLLEAKNQGKWKNTLIVAPTRELAIQVYEVVKKLQIEQFSATLCYGGHAFSVEKNNLAANPNIIIGTPGRIADHIRRKSYDFKSIDAIVTDEEDKIYEIGFQKEMDEILQGIAAVQFSIQVSATGKVNFIHNIQKTTIIDERKSKSELRFDFFKVEDDENGHKALTLLTLLQKIAPAKTLIFFNHREAVERISVYLKEHGFEHTVFHGGLKQDERERNLIRFANNSCNILLVTDLAARGIDVPKVENIIHYQFPKDEKAFVHRNGRTARMGESGNVFCLLDKEIESETAYLKNIKWNFFSNEVVSTSWNTDWVTLCISLGRKNKVNKTDVIGFLTKNINVPFENIGKVNSLDTMTYIAVKKEVSQMILKLSKGKKIKKQPFKIRLSY